MNQMHENRIRPGFIIGLCCVVAAVAIPIWWVLSPTSPQQAGTTTPTEVPDDTSTQARPTDHIALIPQPSVQAPTRTDVTTNVVSRPKPIHSSIATLLGSIAVTIERKTGNGEVTGRVKTSDGQPLANVKVTAILQERFVSSRQNYTKKKDPSLEDLVTETIRAHRQKEANKREALTDASGVYTMAELADADYTMEAKAEGYTIQPVSLSPYGTVHPNATVNFLAKVVTKVPVTVYLPGGALAPRATILFEKKIAQQQSTTSATWTPDDPNIPVTLGSFLIRAQGGEEDELRSEKQKVSFKKDDQPTALVFQLKPGTGIKGRVIAPSDARLRNSYFQVYILKMRADLTADAARLKREGQNTFSHDARFRFDDLTAGTYLIGAAPMNGKVLATETVTVVEETTTTKDLVIPRATTPDMLALWVRGPDGKLIEDVSFGLERRHGGGSSSSGGLTPMQREDGAWLFSRSEDSDDSGEEDAKYIVTASTEEYGEKKAEFTGAEREKTIQFDAPATLKVTLAGYANSANEGRLSLTLEKPKDPKDPFWRHHGREGAANISAEGVATLGPAEVGNYEVVLALLTDRQNRQRIVSQPVQLQAGENRLTMELPTLHTLKISFEQAGATVSLSPEPNNDGFSSIQQKVGKDRVVTVANLLAGKYRIQAYSAISGVYSNLGTMTISVPENVDVFFQP